MITAIDVQCRNKLRTPFFAQAKLENRYLSLLDIPRTPTFWVNSKKTFTYIRSSPAWQSLRLFTHRVLDCRQPLSILRRQIVPQFKITRVTCDIKPFLPYSLLNRKPSGFFLFTTIALEVSMLQSCKIDHNLPFIPKR